MCNGWDCVGICWGVVRVSRAGSCGRCCAVWRAVYVGWIWWIKNKEQGMPDSSIIDALLAGAGTVVAYFVKTTREDNKEQDRRIEELQRSQAVLLSRAEFRNDMKELRDEMNQNFDKVFSKLDKKADK